MRYALQVALGTAGAVLALHAVADITFFENDYYSGRSINSERAIENFDRIGFNDRASSVVVTGANWEVCEHAGYGGRCVLLRPGRYPTLENVGLNDSVSSARMVGSNTRYDSGQYAPEPVTEGQYRRRHDERTYEAQVTSVRAMLGTSGQRCWVEREQVSQDRGQANVPGAIAGAVIGGILGHQVGSGHGQDLATAGGAVAGAAVGANVGRDGGRGSSYQDVRRCEDVPGGARPDYWDVTYVFQGQEHRVQMASPPGNSVTVNERGEPRE